MPRWLLIAVAIAPLAPPLPAQDAPAKKPITLDVMLSRRLSGGGGRLAGAPPALDWSADGTSYRSVKRGKPVVVGVKDGAESPLAGADGFAKSLAQVPGLPEEAAASLVEPPPANRTPDRRAGLVTNSDAVKYVAFADGSPAEKFPPLKGRWEFLTLSPSGRHLAYVQAGNLVVAEAGADAPVPLTADGSKDVLNGRGDWVYEEEIFDRKGQAYWWSPDGAKVAWLRFDDAPVPKFPITGLLRTGADLETLNYPKAGAPNPLVKIGVATLASKATVFLNLGDAKPDNVVISRVGWMSGVPFAYVQDRAQTYLDFLTWPDLAGPPVKLFRDTTKAWVEDLGEPRVLKDGSFLVQSERTGWKHVYHYKPDGTLVNAVTAGEWEAQTVEAIDEAAGWVYVTGTKDGHNRKNLYRAKLDGSKIELLTDPKFSHAVNVAPAGGTFVSTYSNIETPPATAIFEAGKKEPLRVLSESKPATERDIYTFGKVERVQVPTKDGFVLEGILTYPPDFDPAKKYPLWVLTYAGPHTPTVKDAWADRVMEQVIANAGVVAFNVDPRAASGKGAVSAWAAYKRLGVQELKDLEEAVAWVGAKGWLDAKRVGIQGHSYGGYITAYALTHSKVFSAGIAGAPVTDWKLYDTIYTERYMGLPKDNKEGYDKSSVVKAAANLHGPPAADPRHDRRQRAPAELGAVHGGVAVGRQGVRGDVLPRQPARHRGGPALPAADGELPVQDDGREVTVPGERGTPVPRVRSLCEVDWNWWKCRRTGSALGGLASPARRGQDERRPGSADHASAPAAAVTASQYANSPIPGPRGGSASSDWAKLASSSAGSR